MKKARTRAFFGLLMEQGTGKTKVSIDRAGELWAEGKIDAVLVVAKRGVHEQWLESQVPEHFGGNWSGTIIRSGRNPLDIPPKDKEAPALEWMSVTFDGIRFDSAYKYVEPFIKKHAGRLLLIGDETQRIKSASTKTHKKMMAIKKDSRAPYRLMLTGTPIAKDLTDEWAQLLWLDDTILGMRYKSSFQNEFCIMGGFEGRQVIATKNFDRFRKLVDPATFRATKDELGIPPKLYRKWKFDLTKDQKALIKEMKHAFEISVQDMTIDVSSAVRTVMNIQQASNGFLQKGADNVDIVPLDRNPRILSLLELLDAYEGKTIVWCKFRKDIANVASALRANDISFVEYHGGTKDAARSKAVSDFLYPDGARVFLSNPQAGGTGLNLQGECRHAIYYSNSHMAIDRWQSEDRIHRIGTVGSVTYTDLIAKGSIDARILSNLKRKAAIAAMALGDKVEGPADDFDFDDPRGMTLEEIKAMLAEENIMGVAADDF